MVNPDFDALAKFVGSLQLALPALPRRAQFERRYPDGSVAEYQVEAYVTGSTVKAASADVDESIEYDCWSGRFRLQAGAEVHEESAREFPISPPVLCLVLPQFLPIWGGPRSLYTPTSARELDFDRIVVEFGSPGDGQNGSAVIDLEDGMTDELALNGHTYVRRGRRSYPPGGAAVPRGEGPCDFGFVGGARGE